MTGRYARLIAVAILIAAFSASISAQQETVDELRAKAEDRFVVTVVLPFSEVRE